MPANPSDARGATCVMGDYDLVRPLGLAGVRSTLISKAGNAAARSRFVEAVLPLPSDSWNETDSILDTLIRWGEAQSSPPALFYQYDETLLLVSRHRDRLSRVFHFVIADADLVEDLVDKARFQRLGERLGLPIPRTRTINPAAWPDPPDLDLAFPVIIKPRTRGNLVHHMDGAKVIAIDSPESLRANWQRLAALGECLVQEEIPGAEERVESYHAYVDSSGEIVADFTGKKVRTFPTSYGFSTSLVLTDEADVRSLGRDLVGSLKITGVLKADFKRAPDGRLYLLEVNPRFNLWHHLGAVAGVNLPALVHADLCGYPRPPVAEVTGDARWCNVRKDFMAARRSGLPLRAWLQWVLAADVKVHFALDDPGPGAVEAKRWLRMARRRAKAGIGALRR